MMDFEITALKYAESTIAESAVIYGGRPEVRIPISFIVYLIKTEQSYILVDAGCTTMPGWEMKHFCSPAEILKRTGVTPEAINHIILTHSHHDHIEAVYLFENALVHIQEDEYQQCTNKIPHSMKVNLFRDKYVIDGCVNILRIGGHSVGSSVVKIGKYVICGDECYSKICLDKKIPTGSTCNIENSIRFIEEYSKPEYKPLLCHDSIILPGQNGWLKIV